MPIRSKTHLVTVRLRVDKPITAAQARYAVWNAIDCLDLYGDGDATEPWSAGKIRVRRRPDRIQWDRTITPRRRAYSP